MRRAVFLDRDGVLNRTDVRDGKPFAPTRLEDFKLMPDALSATRALSQAGLALVVVTNQPDVGNGFVAREVVETMNKRLRDALPVDAVKTCFHSQKDGCACRKPSPGMIDEACREYGIDAARSFMVGDRWSDVACGRTRGCYTVFIDRGYAEPVGDVPDATVASLAEAADHILARLGFGNAECQ